MTQEQATELKTSLNAELTKAGNTDLTYSVYTFWTEQAVKQYNVILYPAVYQIKYDAANTSGQFAVVRVSLKTQVKGPQTQADFITNFNNEVKNDPEADNLLNK